VTFVNGTYEVYSIAGYTSLLEDYGDVIALNPDEITIDDIKDIEDLIDAYNNLTDDEKAQLTDDEKAAIEALKDKAEEIAKAKENAEEKLAALEGLSAEDIDGNIEDIKQAIADAEEAVKDYTDLSSGLSSEDLEGIENIDAAKEVVDAYDESLTAANEAIAKLDGISAKDIQDGTYTREEVVALIEDATQKIEEFISNGGKLDELTNADLVSSAQGQVDIYNEYAAYIAEHGDTIALSADEIAVSDIENIAKAAEDLTKLSEEAASLT
jgi:DNA repair exonuclease SbcCD ATPase subunit